MKATYIIQKVLSVPGLLANIVDLPISLAAVCEHVDVARHLVSAGADVMLEDDMGTTALDVASSEEIKNIIKGSLANE